MSYYKIFQISTQPISEEDYIHPSDYEEECYNDWRDYMDDELTPEEQIKEIEANDPIFERFFERHGRELTFKGCDDFINEWIKAAQDAAAKLNPSESLSFWDLQKICQQSHCRNWDRYVWTDWTCGYPNDNGPDPLGDFVLTLFKNLKPGDKLYIGGVVSFHF